MSGRQRFFHLLARTPAPSRLSVRSGLRRFARDDSGTLLVFGIFVFIIILMLGGIGVDLMRFERDRSNLQVSMDRAVLAAADLDQTLPPEEVVSDYLAKAGLTDYITSVSVDSGMGYRVVSASASMDFETQFMHMSGVETLVAPAASTAEERIDGVEISLVLDVSGSMNSNSRLTNLKIAAKDFIDQMVENSTDGKLSISIIPYATQVSLPWYMMANFNASDEHSYSHCIEFSGSDFNSAAINPAQPLTRSMHFDPWYTWDGRGLDPVELVGLDYGYNDTLPVCEAMTSRGILPFSKNATQLKNFINNLVARGNTSIDIGMKWGAALLDPSLQPVVGAMAAASFVPMDFVNRPTSYRDGDTLKVIVLMTDGENTTQYYINDGFRTGNSNVWWNEQEEKYSVYIGLDVDDEDHDGKTNEPWFYWPYNNTWHDHAYGEGTYDETTTTTTDTCISYRRNGSCRTYQTVETTVTVDEPGTAALVSYADLWAYTTMKSVVNQLYKPWMGSTEAMNDWYYDVRGEVSATTKNARTQAICNAAKAAGTVVFTIGFEAPSGGTTVLRNCASSDSHFFDVTGLEIADAFSSIASSIRKLRLTQ